VVSAPIVTTLEPERPRGASVPYVGLAEAYIVAAFIVVDPWLNGGQPTVAQRGIRVADIGSRLQADEPAGDVADDYDLTVREVEQIRKAA
jgi:uncharacterized protein (DUF433 family)